MGLRAFAASVLTVTVLGTGAHAAEKVLLDKTQLAAIHTIGVVSAIGRFARISDAAWFSADEKRLDISNWKLDEFVVAQIRDELSANFEIRAIDGTDTAGLAEVSGPWTGSIDDVARKVAAIVPNREGLDAVLVVFPAQGAEPYYDPGRWMVYPVSGLGLRNRSIHDPHWIMAHAFFAVALLDAHSNAVIATAAGERLMYWRTHPMFPVMYCGAEVWPESPEAMSDNQKTLFRAGLTELLKQTIPWTMSKLGLSDSVSMEKLTLKQAHAMPVDSSCQADPSKRPAGLTTFN